MKRTIALLLALASLLALAACGGKRAEDAPGEAETLVEAEYPAMAQRPRQEDYVQNGGGDLPERYFAENRAWREELSALRQLDGEDAGALEPWLRIAIPRLLPGKDGENRAFSPLNLYLALAMLAEVTGGESRQQILNLLGTGDPEALRSSAEAVWRTSFQDDGQTASLLAASLWLNRELDYRQETLDVLGEDYHASSFRGEMGSAAYDALLQDWVSGQTGGLLREQAADLHMGEETVLSLVTALRFKAAWEDSFPASATGEGIFRAPGGEESAAFMHRESGALYFWGEHFGAVSLGMENGGEMWLFLPEEGLSPEELARDGELLEFLLLSQKTDWPGQRYLRLRLSVPRFDITADLQLEGELRELGLRDLFDPETADFSPLIRDAQQVFVSQIRHAARVLIDEEGCEAAAYTLVEMEATAVMPPEETLDFVLDRPFLFVITNGAGLPLFVGIVNHPGAG